MYLASKMNASQSNPLLIKSSLPHPSNLHMINCIQQTLQTQR
jgi:hypothetical protein